MDRSTSAARPRDNAGLTLRVVGIDCATRANKTGVAIASWDGRAMTLTDAFVGPAGSMAGTLPGVLKRHLDGATPTLLALDAPLGWPAALADGLQCHVAGARLGGSAPDDQFFRRHTDERVHEHLGRSPLEVGANFIARTAFAALELLHVLRQTGVATNLLWSPGPAAGFVSGAIEVYPAATLHGHGAEREVYKAAEARDWGPPRAKLVSLLETIDGVAKYKAAMIESDHVLDSVVCVLAARDFLEGHVLVPSEDAMPLAKREGWIWFRPAAAKSSSRSPGMPRR
jgi:predicted RNase H-like nuclease